MISQRGQAIRVALKDIPTLGRNNSKVRIMRLNDDDSVASLGIMPKQEDPVEG